MSMLVPRRKLLGAVGLLGMFGMGRASAGFMSPDLSAHALTQRRFVTFSGGGPPSSLIFYANSGHDPLATVMYPGYFNSIVGQLKVGYLIYDEYNYAMMQVASVTLPVTVTPVLNGAIAPAYPGLVALYDASATNINSGSPTDGTAVSSWSDLSVNGYSAIQATGANQPTWKENVVNGLPAVLFSSSGAQQLVNSMPSTPQPLMVYVLARFIALGAYATLFDGPHRDFLRQDSSGVSWGINAGTTVGAITADTNWHVFTVGFNNTSSFLQIDQAQGFSGGFAQGLSPGTNDVLDVIIGGGYTNVNGANCYVSKLAICSGVHTPEQRGSIQSAWMAAAGLR